MVGYMYIYQKYFPMNIQIVTNFFRKYKAVFVYVSMILWFFLLSSESLFANDTNSWISQENIDKAVEILNGIITLAAALMGMITGFITMFLYPGWTNGTLFGLQEYLKTIWILISNVVYFIFAFILIAIAFMNIIGKGEWTWELKQAMPKFIVWVLIVPFSWFFVQFILSISAVLTVWVLTLPYDSFGNKDLFVQALEDKEFWDQEICKDIIISFSWNFDWYSTDNVSSESTELDEKIQCRTDASDGGWKVTIRELITGQDADWNVSADGAGLQNSIFGVISIYSYGILKIDQLDTLNNGDLEVIKTGADLVFKIIFDVLFVVVYLILMVALLLALFVRWVRLWIYMMLSPVFGLLYFFWSDWVGEAENKFSIKEFVALAMVPVYVSAALAFGLVFMLVAAKWITNQNPDEPDMLQAWGFSLTMIWAQWGSENEVVKWSIIGKLIVQIFWVVILWIAVMAALRQSETTKQITAPIAEFWKSVGQLAAKAPTYAPILPSSLWWSAAWLQSMGAGITSWVDSYFRGKWSERWAEFAESLTPWSGWWWAASAIRTSVNNEQVWLASWTERSITNVLTTMREQWNQDSLNNTNTRREFVAALAAAMGKNSGWEMILDSWRQADLARLNWTAFTTALATAVRDWSWELQNQARPAMDEFLGQGVNASSVSAEQLDRAFSLGIVSQQTAPANQWNQTSVPNTNNVTINVNWVAQNIDRNNLVFPAWGWVATWTWVQQLETALQPLATEAEKRTVLRQTFNEEETDAIIAAI